MSPTSRTSSQTQKRLQLACEALEEALNNFEKTESPEEARRLNERREQLQELKNQLCGIRQQLDELSR